MVFHRRSTTAPAFSKSVATTRGGKSSSYTRGKPQTQRTGVATLLALLGSLAIYSQRGPIQSEAAYYGSYSSNKEDLLSGDPWRILTDAEVEVNSRQIQEWRQRYQIECEKNNTREHLQTTVGGLFTPPMETRLNTTDESPRQQSPQHNVEPCKHTFLDLGANIGDTVGHVVDGGIPFCGELHQKYNSKLGTIHDVYKKRRWNPLSRWVHDYLIAAPTRTTSDVFPEHFCVFSFEGNPAFTAQLQALERRIMGSTPRPVRRTHFFTETVVSNQTGPTSLYLDTVNAHANFDGSSLIPDMYSLRKVQAMKGNDDSKASVLEEAIVMGHTLEDIIKMTLDPTPHSHLMIKMDIEGMEYEVLNQAANALCRLVEEGMFVGLLVELHEQKKRVNRHTRLYFAETARKLKTCGVHFDQGDGG